MKLPLGEGCADHEPGVAPFMGAWIETFCLDDITGCNVDEVAPFMGAWIETMQTDDKKKEKYVAPFMGAWIETSAPPALAVVFFSRTLHGCVD